MEESLYPEGEPTRDEIIESYVDTLAQAVGSINGCRCRHGDLVFRKIDLALDFNINVYTYLKSLRADTLKKLKKELTELKKEVNFTFLPLVFIRKFIRTPNNI
ncbi:hypothetical protein LXL04_030459 [Taraxacum kok-saghyz]